MPLSIVPPSFAETSVCSFPPFAHNAIETSTPKVPDIIETSVYRLKPFYFLFLMLKMMSIS